MIITSIKAENVLKYRSLDLPELPENGVIAISGKNESGKSTIGETVCFALFGRTFSLAEDDLEKVVFWGTNGCSVNLTFRIDNDHYRIERFLDKDGTHSAKFSRVGEEDIPIARGVDGVADAIFMVLGYEYEEFVDSFYLAQREITAPQPNSHTVKAMAGVAALEYVNLQYNEEIAELDDVISLAEFRIGEIDAELDELAIQDGHLSALQDELSLVNQATQENTRKIDDLKQVVTLYRDKLPDIQALRASIGRNGGLRWLSLIFGLLLGGLWLALTRYTDLPQVQMLQEQITTHLPMWNQQHLQGMFYLAIGLGVLLVLSQMRVWILGGQLKKLMETATSLSQTLHATHDVTVVLGDSLLDKKTTPSLADDTDEDGEVDDALESERAEQQTDDNDNAEEPGAVRPSDGEINVACDEIFAAQMRVSEVEDITDRESLWTQQENQRLNQQAARLERAIYDEQQRLKRAEQLNEEKTALEEKMAEAKMRIEVRDLANELLEGANQHLSTQFNNDVRDLVSKTLPLFTEGRYEHLQIDRELGVSVFSGEKRDFLDLEEVSSGTQRQIMLALRLALSQELVNRVVEGEQFLFLDEPFAFFDEARTISSLKVLPQLSNEIKQIFVVAQEFPEENLEDFSKHIVCSREIDIL